jgi:hypothetical protein
MKQLTVIASREASSIASSWTEYLCLARGDTKRFKLFTGRYEWIDEANKYYDEDTGDYVLPQTIAGKDVIGVEEDGVIGGELTYHESDDNIEFYKLADAGLTSWLADQRWSQYKNDIASLIKAAS